MSKQFILAYCVENSNIAKEIEQNLNRADYTFEHACCPEAGDFIGEILATKSEKIILLVSDNFLRSVACMKDGLTWFQSLSAAKRILPVVVDGRVKENGSWKTFPTKIGKVSNVIKYMNFWQEEYLELRKNKRIEGGEDSSYNEHLKDVRTISSEVGEFLRHVRSAEHFSFEEFRHNHYEEFFRWNNDMTWHKKFANEPSGVSSAQEEAPQVVVAPVVPIIEEPVVPIVETPVVPAVNETIPVPEVQTSFEANNPVQLAKPEAIQIQKTEVEEVIEDVVEENIAETIEEQEPIVPALNYDTHATEEKESTGVLEQLTNVEEIEDNSFESLVNEVVAEEEEKQAGEGVTLEDFDKEMFGDSDISASDTVSIDDISSENLFAVSEKPEVVKNEVINDIEKHKVIEEILTNSRAALEKGDVPGALNILKGGTDQYPEEVNLRYYYAYVLANSADNQAAAKLELNTVLKQTPHHADANYLTGEIAELEEDFLAAKRHYSRVIAVDEEYPNAHYRLASILAKRFRGQEELAVNYFKVAAKKDKSNVDALIQMASLYELKLRNNEKAEKYYLKTLKHETENADVYLGLARISRSKSDSPAALDFYKKAVEIDPNLATHANQRLFAPDFVIKRPEAVKPAPVKVVEPIKTVLSEKDIRLQELEADIARLQGKLSEMEQVVDMQSKEHASASTSIHKISGNGNGNGNGAAAVLLGTKTETVSIVKKEPGKVVFITGATSGIGRATSEVFARNGYRVIITGRRWERLQELKNKYVSDYQADIKILSYDVRNPVSVKEAIHSLEGEWRNVDILINNAGLAKGFSPIQEGDMRHWEQMIDTNIKGLLYMTRAVAPHMVERRGGHIINVCSTAGHEVYPNGNVYCATKHAVDALTKSMRIDLHKHNVRVSQVSPGHVEETEFALVRFDGDADRAKIYDDFRPLTASDVAETIYFMATRPAHVNIQDILLMGTQQASSNHVDRSGR